MRSSVYGEIIVLAVFAKSFQGAQYIKREGLISLGLSALILSSSLLFFSLSFPYHIGREIIAPMYEMAALIDYGQTLQRVEPVFFVDLDHKFFDFHRHNVLFFCLDILQNV